MKNIALKLSVITFSCFFASWVAAAMSGINQRDSYPKSLAKAYAAAKGSAGQVEVKKTFSGKGLEDVEIETTSTDVKVERSASGFVELSLSGQFPTTHDPLVLNASDKKLEIKVGEKDPVDSFRFQINFEDSEGGLTVRVPDNVNRVVLKTVSGSVLAEQMKLTELAVKTVSGDLKINRSRIGDLVFQSTSGDMNTDQLEAERFSGKTVSGDFDLHLENDSPNLEVSSTSGDIDLRFRGKPSLKVEFSTVSGEIEVRDEVTGKISGDRSSVFKMGSGKGALSAKTVSGDLFIRGI